MSKVISQLDELIYHHDQDHHGVGSNLTDPARAELAALRARIANDDIAVEEFNAGFEAYRNGVPLTDEPPTTQDQWRVGWGWAAFADHTEAIRQARQQLRATSENWCEDCLYRADAILSAALGEEAKPTPKGESV